MRIKLYQINMDRDDDRVAFIRLDNLPKFQNGVAQPNPKIYNLVFSGDVPCKTLEDVYTMFNLNPPYGYVGRSMSVSDVVEVDRKFHFCDSIGFKEVPFDAALAKHSWIENHDTIRVVLLEPGKTSRIADIDSSLEGMQAVVGGYIEAIPVGEGAVAVCNEEGKLRGLPLNRALRDEDGKIFDVLVGTAFICDCSGESFGSLSDAQIKRYSELFRNPVVGYQRPDEATQDTSLDSPDM